jgi:DNA-binding beta-propeller fold protein YncE
MGSFRNWLNIALPFAALTLGIAPALAQTASAQTGGYARLATIAVPGNPLTAVDFGLVDPLLPLYYTTDRSNAGIDVFDALHNRFLVRITGNATVGEFAGSKSDLNISGPNAIAAPELGVLWASDGDSTIKIINLFTLAVTKSISTGGTARVDGITYDPRNHIMIASNNADSPPFVTLISTLPGREHVIARITFDTAENGIEGLVYNPRNGLFYVDLPQLGDDPTKGGVAVIDPTTATVITTFPIANCQGAGMALGPRRNLLLACATANTTAATPLATQVIDDFSGAVTATIPQISGSDQAAYDPTTLTYFVAARNNPGGSVLGIIDARNNSFLGNVPTGKGAHSVAVAPFNNHAFVPLPPNPADSACLQGCIGVFGQRS